MHSFKNSKLNLEGKNLQYKCEVLQYVRMIGAEE